MRKIDLNCDLGESSAAYADGTESAVLEQISSANIACGFHAGGPIIMEKAVAAAKAAGVAVGAHPAFPDRNGFGRREMACTAAEVRAFVLYQLGALGAFTRTAGMELQHCKVHGALYNMAAKDLALARAIAEAVALFDSSMILLAPPASKLIEAGEALGLRTACEVFADRAYRADGTLLPRSMPGAVFTDAEEIAARARRMVCEGKVTTVSGEDLSLRADSICVHGDNPAALEAVRAIRKELDAAGVVIAPLRDILF